MGYRERDSSAGAVAAIIVGLLLVGLLVVGGGGAMLYFSLRSAKQEAKMERERAMVAVQRAKVEAAAAEAEAAAAKQADATMQEGPAANKTIVVTLDEQGRLQAGGETLEPSDLPAWLAAERDEQVGEVTVVIRVHPRCEFKHVVVVQDACQEAELPFRLGTADEAAVPTPD